MLAGVAFLSTSVLRLSRARGGASDDTPAVRSLVETGQLLMDEVGRIVRPAIERSRKLGRDPATIAALKSGDHAAITQACNAAVSDATEVDAVALFDADGKILGINSIYADGSPIDPQRVDRILNMNFDQREIVQGCVRNQASTGTLEFQTSCDITPAFFDSTGLSVAYSLPVIDPATRQRLGVVSTRLRFERIDNLIRSRKLAGEKGSVYFVSDSGAYFSEEINAGRAQPPIAPSQLGSLVDPLVRGRAQDATARLDGRFITLIRLQGFQTIDGGGIQIMLIADEDWINRAFVLARALNVGTPAVIGLLQFVLAGLIQILGVARARGKELEAMTGQARSASRAKSEFLANMSHEIRTPLTAILGYSDLLCDEAGMADNPRARLRAVDSIRVAGQHLLSIINDILDLSKIEAGRVSVECVDFDLAELLTSVEAFARQRALEKGLTLSAVFASPVPSVVRGDPTRLRQILLNLVVNAVKFTASGAVTLRIDRQPAPAGEMLVFEVQDTGPGMPDSAVQRLFQPFSQSDNSVTRRFGGTGLGLAISRRLARLMGGDVTLAWTVEEKGTCFQASMPLIPGQGAAPLSSLAEPAQEGSSRPAAATPLLSGRILLVEDGIDNQRLIAHFLLKAGATVEVADNGRRALAAIELAEASLRPFDLILTDIQMPEMDGYALTGELRRRGWTRPILAITAHAMAEDRRICLEAGCDDYTSKPIDRPGLIRMCSQWLNASAGTRSNAA